MDLLSGRVAIVTGASRGIGAAIARLFAKEGAKVAVHGRDSAALSAVRAGIEREGGIATQVVTDVTKFSEIEAMRRQVEQTLGPIDIRRRPTESPPPMLATGRRNRVLLERRHSNQWVTPGWSGNRPFPRLRT
jgi:short chain dehydrogenase